MNWALTKSQVQPYMTHKQIAEEMGLTRAAVGRIEERAIKKLKTVCRREGYLLDELLEAMV